MSPRLKRSDRSKCDVASWLVLVPMLALFWCGGCTSPSRRAELMRQEVQGRWREEHAFRDWQREQESDREQQAVMLQSLSLTDLVEMYLAGAGSEPSARWLDAIVLKIKSLPDSATVAPLLRRFQRPGPIETFPDTYSPALNNPELAAHYHLLYLRMALLRSIAERNSPPQTRKKDDSRLIPYLVPYLDDPTTIVELSGPPTATPRSATIVRELAHSALKAVSGVDLGNGSAAWQEWWNRVKDQPTTE